MKSVSHIHTLSLSTVSFSPFFMKFNKEWRGSKNYNKFNITNWTINAKKFKKCHNVIDGIGAKMDAEIRDVEI